MALPRIFGKLEYTVYSIQIVHKTVWFSLLDSHSAAVILTSAAAELFQVSTLYLWHRRLLEPTFKPLLPSLTARSVSACYSLRLSSPFLSIFCFRKGLPHLAPTVRVHCEIHLTLLQLLIEAAVRRRSTNRPLRTLIHLLEGSLENILGCCKASVCWTCTRHLWESTTGSQLLVS